LREPQNKLLAPPPAAPRLGVAAPGAVATRSRRLQDDALFDTADEMLRSKGCIIRVRTERWSEGPDTTTLTVKGPVQPGQMKMREEHETRVDNGSALMQIMDVLGLQPWFRYQKHREEFSAADLVIAIDETPVGTYVELEGSEDAIMSMTKALGRSSSDFIRDSYYRLFQSRREQFGLSGPHMLFPAR
jgi:adenylate cyclase class 2